MFGKTAALALAAAMAMASAADAAPKKGDPNPPHLKASTEEAAKAWVKRYVDDDDYAYIISGVDSAILLQLSTFNVKDAGVVRYWIRKEGFAPIGAGADTYRSSMSLMESDCRDERMKMLAVDSFLASNLQGEQVAQLDDSEAQWFYPRPMTEAWAIGSFVCATAEEYEKQNAAEAAELGEWKPVDKRD